jgi:hypothetical protein
MIGQIHRFRVWGTQPLFEVRMTDVESKWPTVDIPVLAQNLLFLDKVSMQHIDSETEDIDSEAEDDNLQATGVESSSAPALQAGIKSPRRFYFPPISEYPHVPLVSVRVMIPKIPREASASRLGRRGVSTSEPH